VASALAAPLAAQSVCHPSATSNEAQTLAIFSVPLAFGPATAPEILPGLWVGLEGACLPKVNPAEVTPTICRPGQGPLNTDLLFALPRPRIGLPLPFGLALQASWIPLVRVARGEGQPVRLFTGEEFRATRRARGRDPGPWDLRVYPGTDHLRRRGAGRPSPNIFGADFSRGWTMVGGRLRPYLGGGYNRSEPRFRVNFTNQFGLCG
jgi:hypothetical protein